MCVKKQQQKINTQQTSKNNEKQQTIINWHVSPSTGIKKKRVQNDTTIFHNKNIV